jgi:hypothetical protein
VDQQRRRKELGPRVRRADGKYSVGQGKRRKQLYYELAFIQVFDIGLGANIIAMAYSKRETDTLWISINEGATFQGFKFTNSPLTVASISFLPDGHLLRLTTRDSAMTLRTVLVDFRQFVQSYANCTDDQKELWTISVACENGLQIFYYRRIPEIECWAPETKASDEIDKQKRCICDYPRDYVSFDSDSNKSFFATSFYRFFSSRLLQ